MRLAGVAAAIALMIAPAAALADEAADKALAEDMLIRAGMPPAEVYAQSAWEDCVNSAIVRFADQAETAETVAKAAMQTCYSKKLALIKSDTVAHKLGISILIQEHAIEDAYLPGFITQVMAMRAAAKR